MKIEKRQKFDFFPDKRYEDELNIIEKLQKEYCVRVLKAINKMPQEFQQIAFWRAQQMAIMATTSLQLREQNRKEG